MRKRRVFFLFLAGCIHGILAQSPVHAEDPDVWRIGDDAVTGSFDVQAVRLSDAPGNVRRYRLSYPSGDPDAPPPDDRVPAELYLPAEPMKDAPVSAVLILHILNGRYEFERFIAGELARHGIAALWFKLPHYGERRPRGERLFGSHSPDRLIDVFDRGTLDVRRAFDLLASHPEIDGTRIGLLGLSMGGMVATHASSKENRVERLALILSGGNLPGLVAESPAMRQFREAWMARRPSQREALLQDLKRVDPLRAAESVRHLAHDGRVLMINAGADEVVPESSTRALAQALGIEDEVLWVPDVGHYTLSAEMSMVMGHVLSFWAGTPAPNPVLPVDPPIGTFAEKLGTLLLGQPGDSQAYNVKAHIHAAPARGREMRGAIAWEQGPEGRFRLDAHTEEWGRISLGQAENPWVWIEKVGMRMDGDEPVCVPGMGVPTEWDVYRRVVGEVLRMVARVPDLAEERLTIRTTEPEEGGIRMEIQGRHLPGVLVLDWDGPAAPAPRALEARLEEGVFRATDISFSVEEEYRPAAFSPPKAGAAATMGTRDLVALLASFMGIPYAP